MTTWKHRNLNLFLGFLVLGWLLSPSAQASPVPKLLDHFEDRITQVDAAFEQAFSQQQASSVEKDDWEFRCFYMTLMPSVSIGIPDVLELSIEPELSLFWEKVDADNWTDSE